MWGTQKFLLFRLDVNRFIPTHVGNTGLPLQRTWSAAVHPHACGEHRIVLLLYLNRGGSSPRMWGTRVTFENRCLNIRFIPTHVGNTIEYVENGQSHAVHPHACGEHVIGIDKGGLDDGSSPRMWGTQG